MLKKLLKSYVAGKVLRKVAEVAKRKYAEKNRNKI